MSPLVPVVALAFAASVLLVVVHAYLLRTERTQALALWTVAWSFYAARFVVALAGLSYPGTQIVLWLHQVTTATAGMFLLTGALSNARGVTRLPYGWRVLAGALLVWVTASIAAGMSPALVSTPVFVFLAGANWAIALVYARSRRFTRGSRQFVSVVFLLWGAHKLDYPLLRYLPEAALWGYALGALFTMAAGLGLLMAYLEQTRTLADAHRRRFEGLVSSLDDIVFTLDSEGRYTGVYGTWVERSGGRAETYLGKTAIGILGPEAGELHLRMARTALTENRSVTYEWSVDGPEGGAIHYQTTLSPIVEGTRPPTELVGIGRDITELKDTQLSLQQSLAEKATLLQEVHHRVKNNLQIIVSLLRLQSQEFADPGTRRAFEDAIARVAAMASVHESLYESEDISSVPFVSYLDELVQRIVDSYSVDGWRPLVEIDGDSGSVDVSRAIPLGLVATELASNAVKHACAGRSDGALWVEFRDTEEAIVLSVSDNGPGLPEDFDPDRTSSLGMALVSSLVRQLGAGLSWGSAGGAQFVVSVPQG